MDPAADANAFERDERTVWRDEVRQLERSVARGVRDSERLVAAVLERVNCGYRARSVSRFALEDSGVGRVHGEKGRDEEALCDDASGIIKVHSRRRRR